MINEARAAVVQRLLEKRRSLQPRAPAFCSSAPWLDLGSHQNQLVWLFIYFNKQPFQYGKGLAEPLVVLLRPYFSLLIYNSGVGGVRSSTPLARGGVPNTWHYCGTAQVLSHICLRARHHVSVVVRAALGAAGALVFVCARSAEVRALAKRRTEDFLSFSSTTKASCRPLRSERLLGLAVLTLRRPLPPFLSGVSSRSHTRRPETSAVFALPRRRVVKTLHCILIFRRCAQAGRDKILTGTKPCRRGRGSFEGLSVLPL